ncbi:hypothetical protein [Actinacidiphila glaucinigra]|uniref:hypothetical protein n=1 Tax=Actinacidiphila glaucinigra TaxID=235986 RepID=UPI003718B147
MTVTVGATCLAPPAGARPRGHHLPHRGPGRVDHANTTFEGTPGKTACATSIDGNHRTGDPAGATRDGIRVHLEAPAGSTFGAGGAATR